MVHHEEEREQEEPQARAAREGNEAGLQARQSDEEDPRGGGADEEKCDDRDGLGVAARSGEGDSREREGADQPSREVQHAARDQECAREDEARVEEHEPGDHGQGARKPRAARQPAFVQLGIAVIAKPNTNHGKSPKSIR